MNPTDNTLSEDWLRVSTWDVRYGTALVKNLGELLAVVASGPLLHRDAEGCAASLRKFMALPAAVPMPNDLRLEVLHSLHTPFDFSTVELQAGYRQPEPAELHASAEEFGEGPDHPFRGNQWKEGVSGSEIIESHKELDVLDGALNIRYATMASLDEKTQKEVMDKVEAKIGTPEEITARFNTLLDNAAGTPVWNEGMTWYQDVQDQALALAQETGIPSESLIAALAGMSPGTDWNLEFPILEAMINFEKGDTLDISKERLDVLNAKFEKMGLDPISNGDKFSDIQSSYAAVVAMQSQFTNDGNAWGVGRSYLNFERALDCVRGKDIDDTLNGPKIRSFDNNIWDPMGNDVTIDVQMVQAAAANTEVKNDSNMMSSPSRSAVVKDENGNTVKGANGKSVSVKTEIGPTPFLADTIRTIAAERGIAPAQAQAIIWTQYKVENPKEDKAATQRAATAAKKAAEGTS